MFSKSYTLTSVLTQVSLKLSLFSNLLSVSQKFTICFVYILLFLSIKGGHINNYYYDFFKIQSEKYLLLENRYVMYNATKIREHLLPKINKKCT